MANRLQAARDFNPYEKGVTKEDLQRIHRQLAKVMNQRMVRLEQAKSKVTGESYTFGAYEKMQDYLEASGRTTKRKEGGLRFDERLNTKMSMRQLRKEIRAMQGFEASPSSRVAGMKQIENKRIETFKQKGLDPKVVSDKDFYDFMNSSTFERLRHMMDSDQINEDYNRKAEEGYTADEIIKALDDYLSTAKRVSVKGMRRSLNMKLVKRKRRKK